MRSKRSILLSGAAVALILSVNAANAGGFAVREQSTYGQGSAFAGIAAGGTPSSLFWNPATMTQFPGMTSEWNAALILPHASQTGASAIPGLGSFGFVAGVDNSAISALVPASYMTRQLSDRLWVGMSVNAPFGLSVGIANPNWAGAAYAQSTTLKTYNAAPSVAFKLADWISIGAGVQIEYAQANLASFAGPLAAGVANLLLLTGNGWGWGWTAGVTVTPTPTTQIGLGYRSGINQEIEGTLFVSPGGTPGPITTTLNLPGIASLGVRQRIGDQFTLLGTVEWSNWSRIGTANILQASGAAARAPSGAAITLPFQYSDGWFTSLGGEYLLTPAWKLRAGLAYEQSPITDQVRTPRLPDNDRYWASVGASNQISSRLSVDLAYTYIWVKDTHIDITGASGNPWFNGVSYIGDVSSNVHILSIGVKYRWDEPVKALITKG